MKIRLILLTLVLSGCAAMGSNAPADWPNLRVEVNRVTTKEMWDVCLQYTPFLSTPEACAQVYFEEGKCVVTLDKNLGDGHLEHEKLHCKGHDHIGSSTFSNAWEAHKTKGNK